MLKTDQTDSSDSEMELDGDNSNTLDGSTLQDSTRKLRYMDLMNKMEEIQESEDVGLHTTKEVSNILEEMEVLNEECTLEEEAKRIDETIIDSHILSSASSVVLKCIDVVQISNSLYKPAEFTRKILDTVGNPLEDELRERDFLKLLSDARSVINEVPCYGFLYGSFDPSVLPEPKPQKQRQQAERKKAEKKRLENVVAGSTEEASVEAVVGHLKQVLQEEFANNNMEPIGYYEYVVDTDSFATTVENMFYFSFLIRNGVAEMTIDKHGQPVVRPVSKTELRKFREEGGVNTQMITSITEDQWKSLLSGPGFLQRRKLQAGTGF